MKKIVFSIFTIVTIAIYSYTGDQALILRTLDFIAPKVADILSLPTTESGLIVLDTSDDTFKGKKNDGSFVSFGGGGVPVGTILPFAGTTAPDGYLLCDGASISRTVFSDLFAAIGTNFGSADGVTTFSLPDFRGQFLRGANLGSGNDPEASSRSACNPGGSTGDNVGSCQSDQFRSHNHPIRTHYNSGAGAGWGLPYSGGSTIDHGVMFASGGYETRPRNTAVNFIIKY